MPRPVQYKQPIDWRCWANRCKTYVSLDEDFDYQAGATCNDTAVTDVGLCKECYIAFVGEWPPVSGKLRDMD